MLSSSPSFLKKSASANSSPPILHARSPSRIREVSVCAAIIRYSSPLLCPKVSLYSLNLSKSIIIIMILYDSVSILASTSLSKAERFISPVRESLRYWFSHCLSLFCALSCSDKSIVFTACVCIMLDIVTVVYFFPVSLLVKTSPKQSTRITSPFFFLR